MNEFEDIRTLAINGNTIEAIKRAKELCNIGLKESKDLVEALESDRITPASAQIHYFGGTRQHTSQTSNTYGAQKYDTVYSYVKSGKKLQAIKELKELTKLGLKDCKDLIDALESNALRLEQLQQEISSIKKGKQPNATDTNSSANNLIIKEKSNTLVYIIIALAILIISYFLASR